MQKYIYIFGLERRRLLEMLFGFSPFWLIARYILVLETKTRIRFFFFVYLCTSSAGRLREMKAREGERVWRTQEGERTNERERENEGKREREIERKEKKRKEKRISSGSSGKQLHV